jgi:hypothetical protein
MIQETTTSPWIIPSTRSMGQASTTTTLRTLPDACHCLLGAALSRTCSTAAQPSGSLGQTGLARNSRSLGLHIVPNMEPGHLCTLDQAREQTVHGPTTTKQQLAPTWSSSGLPSRWIPTFLLLILPPTRIAMTLSDARLCRNRSLEYGREFMFADMSIKAEVLNA